MAFLEIKGVSKRFAARDGTSFSALEGVDLEIEEGEFVSLIGHSGCGKSTVLSLVAGLTQVSGGEIRVGGKLVTQPGPDRMVVFQNHSLLPWLTIRENIELAIDHVHRAKTRDERRALTDRYLSMVHLTAAADRLPSQVSGGMKQRCGLARGLCTRPKVLLLDEPFGALDALTRANLQDELANIWEADRITVLMITHDVEEALLLSDRIAMMSNGPAARVAEIMKVDIPRPRTRIEAINHPSYYRQRGELMYFLDKNRRKKTVSVSTSSTPPTINAEAGALLEKPRIVVGFIPLLDCAPFAIAETEGLFAARGLDVTLSREPSWKAIADGLRDGRLDAAQMVAGMPIAETLGGPGRPPFPVSTALTLSRGGNAITFGNLLREAGVKDRSSLKHYLVRRAADGASPLVFAIVHQASMHNLVLRAWLAGGGIDPDRDVHVTVIPPPQMVANLQQGNIAACCVGEPWNARAVRSGAGFVCATDAEIWPNHPEKVLGVSAAWATAHPRTHVALLQALMAACERCDDSTLREQGLPALLAQPRYVGGRISDFGASLVGPYDYGNGRTEVVKDLVTFARDGGNLCQTTEALWILTQLGRWRLVALPHDPTALLEQIYLDATFRQAAIGFAASGAKQSVAPLEIAGEPRFDPAAPFKYMDALAIRHDVDLPLERVAVPQGRQMSLVDQARNAQ